MAQFQALVSSSSGSSIRMFVLPQSGQGLSLGSLGAAGSSFSSSSSLDSSERPWPGGVALIQGLGTSLAEQAFMLFCCRIEIDWTQVLSERSHVLAHRAVIGIVDR